MNKNNHRLVFNRHRGMLVAVEETATAAGKAGESCSPGSTGICLILRRLLPAALLAPVPMLAFAQIVAGGAHAPNVIQTQNGLDQVNINRPAGGSGVSVNTYNRFDVPSRGAILNNASSIVQTQQAGMINGNPNLAPGQSAKIIVNQVNSQNPAQLGGYVEVAGSRAEVVLASPSGISVSGGGFINTSRAILTTGTPSFGPDGSLSGFNVTGGNITVNGAGLNASNVDQVDLLARAIQTNAAIYAKNLNVITGANRIDHDALSATPIAGDGPAPGVAVDVSNLGGMYANRVYLVGTEAGVGVSLKGIVAANAGDLVLTTQGKLVLASQANASGNISASARDGIENSGTIYAQQNVSLNTAGALSNSGTVAAQQNTMASAGSVNSTGTLAAGVNSDGVVTQAANLNVSGSGGLTATGHNVSGGDVALSGNGVNLAGSDTSATGNLSLNAGAGDANLTGASVKAGNALSARASGTLTTDNASVSSGGAQTLTAGAMSNHNGQVVSGGTLNANITGAMANQGVMQSAGAQSVIAGSLDNTAGHILSLNGDGLNLGIAGALLNGMGGVIGGNGNVSASAYTFTNTGQVSALANAVLRAWNLDNSGSATAGSTLTATATGALSNAGGTLSGATTTVSGASIDNTKGNINGDALALTTSGDLLNEGGSITQSGTGDQTVQAGGKVSNANGGKIASNASNLSISGTSVDNDSGTIAHAGTNALNVTGTNGVSNVGGNIGSNGSATVHGSTVNNTRGTMTAKQNLSAQAQALVNQNGTMGAGQTLNASANGALDNRGGSMTGATTTVSGGSIDNTDGDIEGTTVGVSTPGDLLNQGGTILQSGADAQTVQAGGKLDNSSGGKIASNASSLKLSGSAIDNDNGSITHAGTDTLNVTTTGDLSNVNGQIASNGSVSTQSASLENTNGSITAQHAATVNATNGIVNANGLLYGHDSLSATTGGDFDNTAGAAQTAGDLGVNAGGTLTNRNGAMTANGAHGTMNVSAGALDNTNGVMTNAGDSATAITSGSGIANSGGTMGGNGDATLTGRTLDNASGGNVVAGGAANLAISDTIDNRGGTAYGGTALNIGQATTAVINDAGTMLGGLDVTANVASFSNVDGAVRANRDIAASGAISGDGEMTSGRNLSLDIAGDYTNTANNHLNADGDMSIHASGTLTNNAELAAGGALNASGANVVNAAGADMNSSATTVTASDTISNAGIIEGDKVTTNSPTLNNTGGIIGNDVTLNATDVTNDGAAAVIAGADKVGIYASNSVTNRNGALIYSAGNLEIGKDGTRDASGMLADQTNTIDNIAADMQAEGDIDLAGHTINNIRPNIVVAPGTPVTTSNTLTMWTADLGDDLSAGVFGHYHSLDFPQWNWDPKAIGTEVHNALARPITVTIPASQVTNLDTTAQSFSLTEPVYDHYMSGSTVVARDITQNATQWYNSLTQNPDGTVSITFWPDFDPNKHIRPDQNDLRFDLGSSHDFVEKSRTTTTTTTADQLVSSGAMANMIAQGAIRMNADGGAINNESSTMAAGGDLTRRAIGGSVNDTGTVLQQDVTAQTTSIYYWHQKTGGSTSTQGPLDNGKYDGITQSTTTIDALPAIATSNQTVQTDAQDITIASVDRHGQTVTGSGVAGGDATGTQPGGVTTNGSATSVTGVTGQGGSTQNIATTGDQTKRPQTLGTADGGIPDLKLPIKALYTYQTAPGTEYLIETNPRFTSYTKFISSDYMLGQLGLNPQDIEKRLGDGYYETQLIREQVTQLTGRSMLNDYATNLDEYAALMNNGVTYSKAFNLSVGMGLTDEQMRQLTTDMVWLVNQTVTLPDGSQQTVLVPKLYLAQSSTVDLKDSGALVAGNQVIQNASGDFSNSGHVVGDVATAIIGNNIVNKGVIGSGGTTTVSAVQDVNNIGGRIGGVDTVVTAGRDINNVTTTNQVSAVDRAGAFESGASSMGVQSVATISGSNSVTAVAARDVNLAGSAIASGGDAAVTAGRDINAGTVALTSSTYSTDQGGQNASHATLTQNVGSAITGAGNVTTLSVRDTTITGSTVAAGKDMAMVAGGDVTVGAAKDTYSHDEQSLNDSRAAHASSSHDEAVRGSTVSAGGSTTLAAGQNGSGNLNIMGSSVTAATGATNLVATGDVNIGGVTETHDAQGWSHYEHSGFLSKTQTDDATASHQVVTMGSTVAGDSVNGAAGHDMTIAGSTVAATNDVALAAANNLTITTTQDTSQSSTYHEEKKSGFGALSGGGLSINYGTRDQKDTANESSVTNNASLVGSTDGSVSMTAGNNLHVSGSDIIAAQNVTGTGANVTIDAAQGTTNHDESHQVKQSGVSVGLAGSMGDAINNAYSEGHAAGNSAGSGDSRAAALHGIAAANDAYTAGSGAAGAVTGKSKPDIGVSVSVGSSSSRSDASESQTLNSGSNVQAGGTAAFVATGNGTPGSGNVTIAGSNVTANDVVLAAKDKVDIVNTTDTDSTRSSNSSSSASVGVQWTTGGGFGISASMSNAHGNANSDAAIQNASHVNGANSVSIASGGDTNVIGSQVNGRQITADVGGNLNIASVQDITNSAAHQSSSGGGFTISQGGGGASFSAQNGHADGSYAGVNEQAGLYAGDGGYAVNVKGNTGLTGAVIASTADASKNSLTTGTLTYSDIANHSQYDANSNGISAGVALANSGKSVGPASGTNGGGVSPMLPQNDSGSSDATTRSAVSAGTITVTDTAHQTQDVAGLSRDTTNTNGTVSRLPDVNALLNQQADRMSAAQAAGQAVAQRIGDYAKAQQAATGDPEWAEGGDKRAAMQAAGAAVVAGLGGGVGSAVAGAAGAAIGSKIAPTLNELSGSIAASNPTGDTDVNKALGNIVANVIATGAGAAAGGAGAFSSSDVDRYNRQLHPDERQWAKDNAGKFAQIYQDQTGQTITPDQAQQMLLASGYRMVDAAASAGPAPDGNKYATAFISQYGGDMFRATSAEYNSPFLYGNADHSLTPEQRALPGHEANPAVGLAIAGALAAPAVLPALAAIPGTPILGIDGALGSAALASKAGTGAISATLSVGSQYIQNGNVNWVDVGGAYATGFIGSYDLGGVYKNLAWNVAVNTLNGGATTAINNQFQGKNDNIIGAGVTSGAFSAIGYGAGAITANTINSIMRPTINNAGSWTSTGAWSGSGYNLFNPNNTAVIGGGITGGTLQEIVQGGIKRAQQTGSKK
ncbi:hemagglutinin repeat-containing protein [Paraburkholderia silviterrae]|nr:hemagglutinin repeat-containing protein [Paraburkholderia silviterrae]